jgi:hexosaminidase
VNRFHGALYLNGQIGTPWQVLAPTEPGNLGAKLSVWNDDPEAATEAEQAIGIAPRLAVIAQKTWESPVLVPTYAGFQQVCAAAGVG